MKRKTYKKKSTASKARKTGQTVYPVKGGYRITKTRRKKAKRRRRRRSWP